MGGRTTLLRMVSSSNGASSSSPASPNPLRLPVLDGVVRWLRDFDDPVVRLLVATRLDRSGRVSPLPAGETDLETLRSAAAISPLVTRATASQHLDGSWGDSDHRERRILTTFWMAKAFADLGLSWLPQWVRAIEFLAARAQWKGIFSVDGARSGVLSCYVGMAGSLYLAGGRRDLAEPQIRWIEQYQDVRRHGEPQRSPPAHRFYECLETGHGGCMTSTTCAIGLIKTGKALRTWVAGGFADRVAGELVQAIRESFLERNLFQTSDGSILPLGERVSHAADWLEPTFPLDWRTDLIEVIDFVNHTGPADVRMQAALDELAARQLDDHTWPLRRVFRPMHLPALERRSRRCGSPYVTLRAVAAVT